MHLEYEHAAAVGLRRYVAAITEELGCSGEAYHTHLDPPPAYAYIALDDRLPAHPGQDTALVWNEHDGWALAIEAAAGHELTVACHLGAGVLPPPDAVARLAGEVFTGRAVDAGPAGAVDSDRVRRHLATYAIPYQGTPASAPVERTRRPAR